MISTHSAREDGDQEQEEELKWMELFQPTPPARTETENIILVMLFT